jgi:hypothetical protein
MVPSTGRPKPAQSSGLPTIVRAAIAGSAIIEYPDTPEARHRKLKTLPHPMHEVQYLLDCVYARCLGQPDRRSQRRCQRVDVENVREMIVREFSSTPLYLRTIWMEMLCAKKKLQGPFKARSSSLEHDKSVAHSSPLASQVNSIGREIFHDRAENHPVARW